MRMATTRSERVDIAKRPDQPPCALVRLRRRRRVSLHAPLLAQRLARRAAFVGLAIKRLRDARRPALLAERGDVDDERLLAAPDAHAVACVQSLRRLCRRIVAIDLAALDRLLGERARLEEARGPEPDIEAHGWRGGMGGSLRIGGHRPRNRGGSLRSVRAPWARLKAR